MHFKSSFSKLFLIMVGFILGSCEAEATIVPTVLWTPIPQQQDTATPTAMRVESVAPTSQYCLDDARFIEDLTIPDGSIVVPGERLDKRWSVLNSGSCDWGPDYRLLRLGDDEFEGPRSLSLYPARAGTAALWQVILEAPMEPGDYFSRWQAQAPDGGLFGEVVYLLVFVEKPTPTPTRTPLVSPTPSP